MSKRFISSLLMAFFFVTAMSVFTSCKDYDDDIARLQEQIDKNAKTLDQINTLVTDGSVISNVEKLGDGIVVTMSNGQKYQISNGTDAIVWTIGDDGFWYKDGVKTDYYALGKDGTNGTDGVDGKDGLNGKDGKDGVDGKDGKDGKDGVDGKDGKDGKDGVDGKDGKDGVDGKDGRNGEDGGYYRPNENGYFDYCDADGNIITPNAVKIAAGSEALTAVLNDSDLFLYNVRGVTSGDEGIKIARSNDLRGLVFRPGAPDGGYVDGVPAIFVNSYKYQPMAYDQKKNGNFVEDLKTSGNVKKVDEPTYAYYHVNPKNARITDLGDNIQFLVEANSEYIKTRAKASTNFKVTGELDKEYGIDEDGCIRIKVNVTGDPATGDLISVVALQYTKKNGEDITSDYATIYRKPTFDLTTGMRIAANVTEDNLKEYAQPEVKLNNAVGEDYHYRRALYLLDPEAGTTNGTIKNQPVWTELEDASVASIDLYKWYNWEASKNAGKDTYPMNLMTYVKAHFLPRNCTDVDLARFGLSFEFDNSIKYIIGGNNTDENNYITCTKDGIVNVKQAFGSSAIDRTPIIRVFLKRGNEILKVAYIKLKIAVPKEDIVVNDSYLIFEGNNFKFNCNGGKYTLNYIEMSQYVYKVFNMSKKQFHDTYDFAGVDGTDKILADEKAQTNPTITAGDGQMHDRVGMISEIKNTGDMTEEGTHVLQWTFSANDMWKYAGQTVYQRIKYENKGTGGDVYITMKVKFDGFDPNMAVAEDKKIDNYWNADKNLTRYTVRVPNRGEVNPANCLFFSNLNAPFRTRVVDGKEMIDFSANDPNGVIKKYIYQFDASMNNMTLKGVDGNTYKYRVVTNGLRSYLYAKPTTAGSVEKLIAEIINENTTPDEDGKTYPYMIELKKHVDYAENLLNTNNLIVRIGIVGYACGDANKSLVVNFVDKAGNKTPYYEAKLMRPVNIDTNPAEYFQDAVDFGEPHSYIDLWDLLNPYDWRGTTRNFTDYPNYWFYYGCDGATTEAEAFKIASELEAIEVNFNNGQGWEPVPSNIKVEIVPTISGQTAHGGLGFLTYRANDVYLEKDMTLRVKFGIEYGWGNYVSEWVNITVKSTNSVQAPRR